MYSSLFFSLALYKLGPILVIQKFQYDGSYEQLLLKDPDPSVSGHIHSDKKEGAVTVLTNREAKGSVARTERCDIFGAWAFHELGQRFGYWGLNRFKLGKRASRLTTVLLYISYYDILRCYNFGANILYSSTFVFFIV